MLVWHKRKGNYREFPWRRTRDPYRMLVAELLLQRTRAEAVTPVYREWLKRWRTPRRVPSPKALTRLLGPLGLPTRIPWMRAILVRLKSEFKGVVPKDSTGLKDLLGSGRVYMRNAILIFACDEPIAAVDRTIARVLSRVFLGKEPPAGRPHADRQILTLASSLVPQSNPREYHIALLDFAATVCKPHACIAGNLMDGVCLSFRRQCGQIGVSEQMHAEKLSG